MLTKLMLRRMRPNECAELPRYLRMEFAQEQECTGITSKSHGDLDQPLSCAGYEHFTASRLLRNSGPATLCEPAQSKLISNYVYQVPIVRQLPGPEHPDLTPALYPNRKNPQPLSLGTKHFPLPAAAPPGPGRRAPAAWRCGPGWALPSFAFGVLPRKEPTDGSGVVHLRLS